MKLKDGQFRGVADLTVIGLEEVGKSKLIECLENDTFEDLNLDKKRT